MQLDRKRFEAIYSRYRESGLTVNDFCSNEGLPTSKFYYRQKRIRSSTHPLVRKGFLPLSIDPPAYSSSGSPGGEKPIGDHLSGGCHFTFAWKHYGGRYPYAIKPPLIC